MLIYRKIKRIFDFFLSLIGIILASPVFLFGALAIKLTSKGPVFYMGERVGKNGNLFSMYKFRTMIVNADKIGGPSTPIDELNFSAKGLPSPSILPFHNFAIFSPYFASAIRTISVT